MAQKYTVEKNRTLLLIDGKHKGGSTVELEDKDAKPLLKKGAIRKKSKKDEK